MLSDPICCAPRVDRFLAVTEIRPLEPEAPELTDEELQELEEHLLAGLYDYEKIKFDI